MLKKDGSLSDTGLSEPAGAGAAVQQVDKLVLTVSWGWAQLFTQPSQFLH